MTSDGFDPDPAANRDVDGVLFPDMPWLLAGSGPVAELRGAVGLPPVPERGGGSMRRLVGFGYDAAQLMVALRNPQTRWPVSGVTGRLQPGDERRIRRDLDWAQVRGGLPQAVPGPTGP